MRCWKVVQCNATTQKGIQCKKRAKTGSDYCRTHADEELLTTGQLLTAAGGVIGHLVAPGIGTVIGTLAGATVNDILEGVVMAKKVRAFISFDYDNDKGIKELLVGQSKNDDTPFEIADWSVKDHLTGDWKEKVRAKIKQTDQVIVLCGKNNATGVNAEVKLAQEESKSYFLLKGYKDKTCIKPNTAKSTDKMYGWTWPNLKTLIGGGR